MKTFSSGFISKMIILCVVDVYWPDCYHYDLIVIEKLLNKDFAKVKDRRPR